MKSRVAQWKRARPITQRSENQNLAWLNSFFVSFASETRTTDARILISFRNVLFFPSLFYSYSILFHRFVTNFSLFSENMCTSF